MHLFTGERRLRTNNNLMRCRINADNIERALSLVSVLATANAKAAPLADGIVNYAGVRAKHGAIKMNDLSGLDRAWPQPPHDIAITTIWHETDILTVRLVSHTQAMPVRQLPGFLLAQPPKGKPQIVKLVRRCRKQEIGLVLTGISTTMENRASSGIKSLDIVTGGKTICAQITGGCQQIREFDRLIASDTGNGRFTAQVAVGKILHHLIAKPAFIIEHIMRNAKARRHSTGIMDIDTGATGPFRLNGDTMIIELQGNADDLITLLMQQGGGHRTVDTA